MKKALSILIALVLVFSLSVVAFADTTPKGKITVTNTTTDTEYNIYKVFDAKVSKDNKIAYTFTGSLTGNLYFTKDTAGNVTATAKAVDKDGELNAEGIAALKALIDANKIKPANATPKKGNGGAIVFDGLDFGYYYVTSSLGTAVSVDSTDPDATVIDKNTSGPGPQPETPFKSVKEDAKYVTETSASVGKTLSFKVAFSATNFNTYKDKTTGKAVSKQVASYTIIDTPTGLKIDWDKLAITVDGKKIVAPAYTLTKADNKIVITWVKDDSGSKVGIYDSPVDVVITYEGEVVACTEKDKDITNNIDITCQYVGGGEDPVTPVKEPGDDPDVKVVNYAINLKNVDDAKKVLDGAVYNLYEKSGAQVMLIDEGKGVYRVATTAETKVAGFKSAPITAGDVTIKGLGDGNYEIEQVSPTDGYTKLVNRESVTIDGADEEVEIVNKPGTLLPTTGTTETIVLMVIGSLLVAVAGIFLVTNKKMSKESF